MAYADFTFYEETYLGTAIAEADFPRLALEASAVIDRLTYDRAAAVVTAGTDADTIERIGLATCAVAEALQAQANQRDGLTSERVGSYAVTYASPTSRARVFHTAAAIYLGGTPLLYRGFAAGEYGG